ncbi:helix-turn-helix domain-containing protein [Patescibacteria group bacterium]|nr:helix-turn-helix domain-containing protein [Patescibacteria group bacterium]MDE1946626.1 helix-turn-helix domain-containing protein [Patescibacteria group bacterium]MDE2010580.1 helix-turn-helix domain-containing protein [Patescibacteria group bacterium]MDE2233169.1 helix-turn-helix domain-containing protein [Patescibacteria group bacterium]
MTRFNPQIISRHLSYTLPEIAAKLHMTKKSLYRWIDEGLPIVPGQRKPILIHGDDLKTFINARNSRHKVKLKRHEFYCFRCRAPRQAKRGTITKSGYTRSGECSVCNGKMQRKFRPYQKDYHISSSPVQMSTLFDNLT